MEATTSWLSDPARRRIPPAGLLALGLAAQHALAGRRSRVTTTSGAAAAAVAAGSAWLIGGSVARFRRRGTTVNPLVVGASSLITTGPNRLTRNPMYVGMAGLLLAHAVARRSGRSMVPAAIFVAAIDRLQIPPEEAALRARFGADFDAYAATTPRWLDWRSPATSGIAGRPSGPVDMCPVLDPVDPDQIR